MVRRVSTHFEKWEGLGNDFVIVSDREGIDASAVCDRHRGVGADGVLVVKGGARPSMAVINADGSEPEMCGNGLRCAALYLVQQGHGKAGEVFVVDTAAGPHPCEVIDAHRGIVRIAMRAPQLTAAKVPTTLGDQQALDVPFEVLGRTVHITAVSMGNPHAVIFDAVDASERASIGPAIERDVAAFPERVNVGFAQLTGARAITLHVFERGAGWTEACGTGACAAAVAAIETGRIARGGPIVVTLPGGTLEIEVRDGEPVSMTGPARKVFVGELS
jgi:diaminopimelate epimerase